MLVVIFFAMQAIGEFLEFKGKVVPEFLKIRKWFTRRKKEYDDSIVEIRTYLADVAQALKANTKLTEEMFIQSSRDRIIDFATKTSSKNVIVSREEFNRIFKVYDKYEKFLEEHEMTNGEVDIAYRIIKDAYENRLRSHSFIEDIRGYNHK